MTNPSVSSMTDTELEILRYFRRYHIGVGEMLFFDTGPAKSHPAKFHRAMESLVRVGLVMEERPRGAYSLTARGYRASLSA